MSGSTDLEPGPEASSVAHAPSGGDFEPGRHQISKFENFASALNPARWIAPIGTWDSGMVSFMAVGPDNGHLSTPFFSLAI